MLASIEFEPTGGFRLLPARKAIPSSGLSRPVSAASYATRRTAARRRLIVDDESRRDSNSSRYRSTTALLKASCGSEQYHATKSSIANRYERFDSADRSVFKTALLAKSRSGRRKTRLGVCLAFLGFLDKRSPYPLVESCRTRLSIDGKAVLRARPVRVGRRPAGYCCFCSQVAAMPDSAFSLFKQRPHS
jgi:hypothetical protein